MPDTYQTTLECTVVIMISTRTRYQIIAHLNRRRSSLSSTISGPRPLKPTAPSVDRRRQQTLETSAVPLCTPPAAVPRPLIQVRLNTDWAPTRRCSTPRCPSEAAYSCAADVDAR